MAVNWRRAQHRLRKSLAQRGAWATAAYLLRRACSWLSRPVAKKVEVPKSFARVHPFDERFGVETSGLLYAEDLLSGKAADLFNNGYFGVAPSALRQVIERLALDLRAFTLVDIGSGKGRALLIASEYPFKAIIGVELSPALHAIAAANIKAYRNPAQQCHTLCSLEIDATKFEFPPGPLIVYLWNPFAKAVLARVLANLESSLAHAPRDIYILYIQPDLDEVLEASGCWRKLWREEFPLSEEDYAASAFPPRVEVCSAYRGILSRATPP
jgi:SAM-dependent methyltransferase